MRRTTCLMLILAALLISMPDCLHAEEMQGAGSLLLNVEKGKVTAKIEDAEFGHVLYILAQKAGFEAVVSSDIYSKRLSTSFDGLDIQRSIARLLDLISQKNYFVYYNPDKSIRRIEVFKQASAEVLKEEMKKGSSWMPATGPALPVPQHPFTDNASGAQQEPDNEEQSPRPTYEAGGQEQTDKPGGPQYIPPVRVPEFIPPSTK